MGLENTMNSELLFVTYVAKHFENFI